MRVCSGSRIGAGCQSRARRAMAPARSRVRVAWFPRSRKPDHPRFAATEKSCVRKDGSRIMRATRESALHGRSFGRRPHRRFAYGRSTMPLRPFVSMFAFVLFAELAATSSSADGGAQAPAWPNLLSEAGRRAAMALPKSSPYHLEPTLQDLEDATAGVARTPTAKQRWERARIAAGAPPNTRANNPMGDVTGETQSETAIAAFGDHIVVAWNDSRGFTAGNTVSSFAYSTDGGATFTDGGNVPLATVGDQAFGDCTLDVDANGNFYLCQIYVSNGLQSTGVHRGTFNGSFFTWSTPVIASSGASGAIDKCYLCVDRTQGDVYVSYTRFGTPVTIEVVRGTALGTTWSTPVVLDSGTSGIQGSRPVVGPEGNLYVCWQSGWGFINCDLSNAVGQVSFRRSLAGMFPTFGAVVNAGAVTMNWLSYWGGNLRGNSLFFPDMAVDRSGGPNQGNIYVAWNESAAWTANAAT